MKSKITLSALLLASSYCHAHVDADPLFTFINSRIVAVSNSACSQNIVGYRERFEPGFAKWTAEHRDYIASGERIAREGAAQRNVDFEKEMARKMHEVFVQITGLPKEKLLAQCEFLFRRYQTDA